MCYLTSGLSTDFPVNVLSILHECRYSYLSNEQAAVARLAHLIKGRFVLNTGSLAYGK